MLERGETANSWRTERWDSLRLLTPNWLSRLPGWAYRGDDPDGYMSAVEVVGSSRRLSAVVRRAGAQRHERGEHRVVPDGPRRRHRRGAAGGLAAVVVATGACSDPHIPAIADDMPDHLQHVSPIHYRNPDQLADGGVLVVGASASGLQIADELSRAAAR